MTIVAGLDLSLTGLGAVAIPSGWDLDFRRVERCSFGIPLSRAATPSEVTERLRRLTRDVSTWLARVGASHVFAEDLPARSGFNVVPLAELRGVLRVELHFAGLTLDFVNSSHARKVLLGRKPPERGKAFVVEALKAAGADFDDADQADAFCTANARLDRFGIPHLHHLLWPPSAKGRAA